MLRRTATTLLVAGLLALSFASVEAQAARSTPQGKGFGIGLQLGFPTALTLKLQTAGDQGLVVGFGGFGPSFDPAFSLHVDYLFHAAHLVRNRSVELNFYLGFGGWLLAGQRVTPWYPLYPFSGVSPFAALARVPLGLSLMFARAPFEIYVEITPAMMVVPVISLGAGGSLGLRFYF